MAAPLMRRAALSSTSRSSLSTNPSFVRNLSQRALLGSTSHPSLHNSSPQRSTPNASTSDPVARLPVELRHIRNYTQRPNLPTSWAPIPYVQEQIGGIHHTVDLFSRLLKERIICLNGTVDDVLANVVVASLLFLEADNPEKPISLYINSPGGSVTAGLAIYDTMQYIQSEVSTICMGHAASMGSLLLAGGAPGKRYALPHSSIMLHQPSGGYFGQASDIAIHAKEILRVRTQLNGIYKRHLNGKKQLSIEAIENMLERDYFLSAEEGLEFGIIDEILDRRVKPTGEDEGKPAA